MKKLISTITIPLFYLLPITAHAGLQRIPVLAVVDFETIQAPQTLSQVASELIRNQIVGNPEFQVVERAQLDKLMTELNFGLTDFVDQKKAMQFGKLSPVTHLVMGSIVKLGSNFTLNTRVVHTETGITTQGETYPFTNENQLITICQKAALDIKRKVLQPIYSASAYAPGSGPEKAFDGNTMSSWIAPSGTYEGWLEIAYSMPKNIRRLGFVCKDSAYGAGVPKHFEIEIYRNHQWETLTTVQSNRRVRWSRKFTDVTTNRIRLQVYSVINPQQPLQIAEFQIQ